MKVALIGSGNWGSAIARIIGENVKKSDDFQNEIKMWVFEEDVNGEKLTHIINTRHENIKYLPGYILPENIVASADLEDVAKEASILVFCLPHQFLPKLLPVIQPHIATDAFAVSLIKGIDFNDNGVELVSNIIRKGLNVDCSVLMGANVANEVASGQFCETTIGCSDLRHGALLRDLFHAPNFRVSVALDPNGVELCGALKNIIGLGAGFCDGLGYGGNTKAAIIRIGLLEMKKFCFHYYQGIKEDTFFESCGLADLITTCFGGRNRKCAEAFVKTGKSWSQLEDEMLDGQKLQGTLAAKEVYAIVSRHSVQSMFPLFCIIYKIAFEGLPAENITMFEES